MLAALLYFPLFGHLNNLPIRIWDESRLATNAYEMHKNGNLVVTHFEGQPDMWNTKPPLMIWCQAILMNIIGVNELAVRLPSAFAALLTCLAILLFSLRHLKSFWFGFIAVMVLLTSQGYIVVHSTRTGDYDALLTMFTTLSGLMFFLYCDTLKNKHLYFFFVFTALAVLTKSITGLLFLPALFMYAVLRRRLLLMLRQKHFYAGAGIFILVIGGYYLLREIHNPGYLQAVMDNEIGGRYLATLENHKHGFSYYLKAITEKNFSAWYLLALSGLVIGMANKYTSFRNLALFSGLMTILFLLIISISQTKLEWYDVPSYPFASILAALFIYYIFKILLESEWVKSSLSVNVIPYIFLFLIFIFPYNKIIDKTYLPQEIYFEGKDFYDVSYYLRKGMKEQVNLNDHYVAYSGYNPHIAFYINILKDKGVRIDLIHWETLENGHQVIASQAHVREYIEANYVYEVKEQLGSAVNYHIHGRKT